MVRFLLGCAVFVGLLGCFGAKALADTQAPDTLMIRGSLTYMLRIALAPDARAVVELRREPVEEGRPVAELRFATEGRQVPLPFELAVARAELDPASRYFLRAGVFVDGLPQWVTEPVKVDLGAAAKVPGGKPQLRRIDLGAMRMSQPSAGAFQTVFRCGDERVVVGYSRTAMLLTVGGETFEMRQVPAASGAKYEAVTDPTTSLWNQGDATTITVRDRQLGGCVTGGVRADTLRAHGNEPFWGLQITPAGMRFTTPDGALVEAPAPRAEAVPGGRRWTAKSLSGKTMVATVLDSIGHDSMSGMPHPNLVTVKVGRKTWHGWGGDPRSILLGGEWVVEDLNRGGIIDRSRISLLFDAEGRLGGLASCNRYTGQYEVSGEGLRVSKTASTLRACAPSLMDQEKKFLELLQSVQRFEIDRTGALVLHTADGRTILARR
jgi:heat shock protein HslJ/uncharacterized membrane protein/uncharacterized lipoprotein YbaY